MACSGTALLFLLFGMYNNAVTLKLIHVSEVLNASITSAMNHHPDDGTTSQKTKLHR
jgi:hypothetical protein